MAYISKWETEFYLKSASTNWHSYKKVLFHQFMYDEWKKNLVQKISMVVMVLVSTMPFILCLSVCPVFYFFISQVIFMAISLFWVNLEKFSPYSRTKKAKVVTSLERTKNSFNIILPWWDCPIIHRKALPVWDILVCETWLKSKNKTN